MQEKKSFEFHIGATLFSVIGALFILIALVLLGINYLSEFVLQMSLYGVGALVIILAELLLRRFNDNVANIISSIGLGVLFVPTLINGTLKNVIGGILAIFIAFVIGVAGVFFGYYRKSIFIRILNMAGVFAVIVTNLHADTELKLLIVAVIILCFGILNIYFANEYYSHIINSVHIVLMVAVAFFMNHSANTNSLGPLYVIFAQLALFIVSEIAALFGEKRDDKITMWFGIAGAGLVELIMCVDCNLYFELGNDLLFTINKILCLVLIIAVCALIYVVSDHEKILSKIQVYIGFAALLGLIGVCKNAPEFLIVIASMLGLRFLGRNKNFCHLDSAYYLLCGLMILASDLSHEWYVCIITLAVYIAGIFLFKYNYVYNEIVSIIMIGYYIIHTYNTLGKYYISALDSVDAATGLEFLVVGLILIYYIGLSVHKNKNQLPVTIVTFAYQGIIFIGLISINFVYMIFNNDKEIAGLLIDSVLIMATAVVYIIYGFKIDKTYFRIIGLVISVLVCLKILVMDLNGVDPLYRILSFLGTGVLALVISALYLKFDRLEKIEQQNKRSQAFVNDISEAVNSESVIPSGNFASSKEDAPSIVENEEKVDNNEV